MCLAALTRYLLAARLMTMVGGFLEWPTLLKVGSYIGLCHPSYSVGGGLLASLVGLHSLSQSGTTRKHTLLIRG